jgi:hypothetical protein
MTFHTNFDLDEGVFTGLKAAGQQVLLDRVRLQFRQDERMSERHGKISLDGLTGEFVLDLEHAPNFWPFLWAGQWVHVGKHAAEGLGRYRVNPA